MVEKHDRISIDIVNDQYLDNSIKYRTYLSRAERNWSFRVHVQGTDQKILKGKVWVEFFNNSPNEYYLIELAYSDFQSEEGRSLIWNSPENQ